MPVQRQAGAAQGPPGPQGRPRQAQLRQGHRSDDQGRTALTGDQQRWRLPEPPEARRRRAGASAPARLSASPWCRSWRSLIALFSLIPLGYVVGHDRRHRLGHRRRPDLPRPRRRAAAQHRPAHAGHRAALPRPRRRRRLAGRTHPPARATGAGPCCSRRRWPSRPSSTATPGFPRSRRSAGSGPACSSRRCPTSRSSTSRPPRRSAASTRRIEQSAASLGLGAWRAFFRVVLPQLRIAMTGGALLVGLHLLAEYGAFAMIRFDTFTTAIMVQYQSTFNGAAGNMLASVLVVPVPVLLLVPRSAAAAPPATRASAPAVRPHRGVCRWAGSTGRRSSRSCSSSCWPSGSRCGSCVRWVVLGGSAIWAPGELVPALLQTLLYGVAGAAATTARRLPDGLPRRAASQLVQPARSSCPTTSPARCPASSSASPSSP